MVRRSGIEDRETILFAEGERREIDVVFASDGAVCGVPSSSKPLRQRIPKLTLVLGGVGAGLVLAGATLGAIGALETNDLDECKPNCSQERIDGVRPFFVAGDVIAGFGVLALGAAVITSFSDNAKSAASSSPRLVIGAGGVGGTFSSATDERRRPLDDVTDLVVSHAGALADGLEQLGLGLVDALGRARDERGDDHARLDLTELLEGLADLGGAGLNALLVRELLALVNQRLALPLDDEPLAQDLDRPDQHLALGVVHAAVRASREIAGLDRCPEQLVLAWDLELLADLVGVVLEREFLGLAHARSIDRLLHALYTRLI
jgi:hypothetical protein